MRIDLTPAELDMLVQGIAALHRQLGIVPHAATESHPDVIARRDLARKLSMCRMEILMDPHHKEEAR